MNFLVVCHHNFFCRIFLFTRFTLIQVSAFKHVFFQFVSIVKCHLTLDTFYICNYSLISIGHHIFCFIFIIILIIFVIFLMRHITIFIIFPKWNKFWWIWMINIPEMFLQSILGTNIFLTYFLTYIDCVLPCNWYLCLLAAPGWSNSLGQSSEIKTCFVWHFYKFLQWWTKTDNFWFSIFSKVWQ